MICNSLYAIDFAVKSITISFPNNMNPGAGDQFYPYGEFAQYPQYRSGWIYPYMLNDGGNVNHSPSASVTKAESLPEPPRSSSKTAQRQALAAWRGVLFTDFILKCDCSFPDKFFVTGRFQVGFVLDKSEIAL